MCLDLTPTEVQSDNKLTNLEYLITVGLVYDWRSLSLVLEPGNRNLNIQLGLGHNNGSTWNLSTWCLYSLLLAFVLLGRIAHIAFVLWPLLLASMTKSNDPLCVLRCLLFVCWKINTQTILLYSLFTVRYQSHFIILAGGQYEAVFGLGGRKIGCPSVFRVCHYSDFRAPSRMSAQAYRSTLYHTKHQMFYRRK